jgi:protein O-mannosyl-transferase
MPSHATDSRRAPDSPAWIFTVVALTLVVYAPGMGGKFVYDDLPFIVNNANIHVTDLSLDAWMRALFSLPEAHVGRWLSMLSFAINYYFFQLSIVPYKIANLCIHVLNGAVLTAMLRKLVSLSDLTDTLDIQRRRRSWIPIVVAGVWLILPINLTAVLYVSQRMESFCQLFVLVGLCGYLGARIRHFKGEANVWPAALWLLGATAAGCMVKESAILLPLYAFVADVVLTGLTDNTTRRSKSILLLFGIILGLPFIAGTVWLSTWIFGSATYAMNFGTMQRLLTESRVVVDYIQWTLFPRIDQLALLHDDYDLSRGLFAPLSTALSILSLSTLLAVAWIVRRTAPLATVGILWFFAGHVLTATIIPLDLVFEHRNYFASIGLLLAVVFGFAALPLQKRARTLLVTAGVCCAAYLAVTTIRRAYDWGDPLRFVLTEAAHRPQSSDAQYQLAVALSRRINGIETTQARLEELLTRAAELPGASIAPEASLIIGRAQLGRDADARWWSSLIAKLRSRASSRTDINALRGILQCHLDRKCPDTESLVSAYLAALQWPHPSVPLLVDYADLAYGGLQDSGLAEQVLRTALIAKADDVAARTRLIKLLTTQGRIDEAKIEISTLRSTNRFGALDAVIANLEVATKTRDD